MIHNFRHNLSQFRTNVFIEQQLLYKIKRKKTRKKSERTLLFSDITDQNAALADILAVFFFGKLSNRSQKGTNQNVWKQGSMGAQIEKIRSLRFSLDVKIQRKD
ncbi:hypothetical protein DLM78_09295 [Leptospira stimsonii]|uniref:Uncharacterized protein n=1 Tax=Leptospira stimsonii TaxID=2202203 RepID=A0A8B3CRF4_9LEPT|nr:hypothetical protein DLM78_09295 [Leptospira stimsonii]